MQGPARARYVQGMFARIAGRYDLMNRLMTVGQDARWRRALLDRVALPPGGRLLDLGTGTGDIAAGAVSTDPTAFAVGADFTIEMMRAGQQRAGASLIRWTCSDALLLPFPNDSFDAVTSGFLLRNVSDVHRALAEQFRVLRSPDARTGRPGGRVVCLDTTPPRDNLLRPALDFHMHTVIPTLGRIITGAGDAYRYLPDSTEAFLPAEALAEAFRAAGFVGVGFKRMMFGAVALHWGVKPK